MRAGHLTAEIIADHAAIAPGGTIHVALRQQIDAGWHTYWRNPGDSGEATTLDWTLPTGWKTGQIVWPAPQQLKIPPLMDYGYTGAVLLPVTLTAPVDAKPGQTVTLKAHAAFLVCQEVCVPEDAQLSLDLPWWSPRTRRAMRIGARRSSRRIGRGAASLAGAQGGDDTGRECGEAEHRRTAAERRGFRGRLFLSL